MAEESVLEMLKRIQRNEKAASGDSNKPQKPVTPGAATPAATPSDTTGASSDGGKHGGNIGGGSGGGGSGGRGEGRNKWTWNNFIHGLTFNGVVHSVLALFLAVGLIIYATHDTPTLRASNEKEYLKSEKEKVMAEEKTKQKKEETKQLEIIASTGGATSLSIPSIAPVLVAPTIPKHITNSACVYSARNDAMLVPAGGCLVFDNTWGGIKALSGSESATPVVSVDGDEFVIISADRQKQCSSKESSDRCSGFITQHQTQVNGGLYRFLYEVPMGQKITIRTQP